MVESAPIVRSATPDASPGAGDTAPVRSVVVGGNNVMGTRRDGRWRDRPAAARRLLGRVQCWARGHDGPVVLVLDVPQADLPEGDHGGVAVRYATRRGRDAADDRIVALVEDGEGAGLAGPVEVVTSDRALAARLEARGAVVVGARTFLDRLDAAGC